MKDAGGMQMKSQKKKISKNVRNKILCFFGALLLSGVTIAAVLKGGGISPDELKGFLLEAKIGGIFFAVVCMLGFIFFEGAALTVIVRALGYPVKHGRGFLYSAADIYFSAITPSASGGQPASAFFMIRDGIPVTAVMASLVLNLIMYTLAVVTTGVLAVIFFPETYFIFDLPGRLLIAVGVLIMLGLSLVFYLLLKKPDILKKLCGGVTKLLLKCTFLKKRENYIEKVHGFEADFSSYTMKFRSKMRYVLLAILWSIPQVILQMSVLYVVFRAFSLDLPYGELLCMQTMLQASVCFIPLPGASGAQELGFSMFFKSYFASGDILYTAVLVWRFFTYYIIVLLGALVVVIDQLVFGCRRKQEAALSAGKE